MSGTGTDAVYSSSWQNFKSVMFIQGSDNIDPQTSTLDVDEENVKSPLQAPQKESHLLKKWRKSGLSYIRRQSSAYRCLLLKCPLPLPLP